MAERKTLLSVGGRYDVQFGAALLAAPVVWLVLGWGFGLYSGLPTLSESFASVLLLQVLLYPVCEELIFRGLMQGELRRHAFGLMKIGPFTSANLLTSMVFTAMHFLVHTPLAAVLVMFPSLIFGYFRDRYDGNMARQLAAPVLLHVWYNAGYFIFLSGTGG